MCFHGNQHPSSIKHRFISLYSKYHPSMFICLLNMNSPVFPSLDDIYCIFRITIFSSKFLFFFPRYFLVFKSFFFYTQTLGYLFLSLILLLRKKKFSLFLDLSFSGSFPYSLSIWGISFFFSLSFFLSGQQCGRLIWFDF